LRLCGDWFFSLKVSEIANVLEIPSRFSSLPPGNLYPIRVILAGCYFRGKNTEAKSPSPGSVGILYDRHAPWLLAVCLYYMGNREDAEDVLHDGFMKIIWNIGISGKATGQPRSLDAPDHGEYGAEVPPGPQEGENEHGTG